MGIKSLNRIISAKDYGGSGKAYLKKQQETFRRKGVIVNIRGIDNPQGKPVEPRIWQGQWIADCEDCGGASFIDPEEPIFFCFGCGNRSNGGWCRPVLIPDNWREIEQALLERPVNDVAGLTDGERAALARPLLHVERDEGGQKIVLPLTRSWRFGETLEDLRAQQDEALRRWRQEVKDGI